jgi:hypothetical protein
MKPNTALAIMLCGVAVAEREEGPHLIIDLPKEPRDAQIESRPYPTADCRRP